MKKRSSIIAFLLTVSILFSYSTNLFAESPSSMGTEEFSEETQVLPESESTPEIEVEDSLPTEISGQESEPLPTDDQSAATTLVDYVYIDEFTIVPPLTQNIVVGFSSDFPVESATLYYKINASEHEWSMPSSLIVDNAALFTRDFSENDEKGTYQLTRISYFADGIETFVSFSDISIDSSFQVEALEKMPETDGVTANVYTLDDNGNVKEASGDVQSAIDSIIEDQPVPSDGMGLFAAPPLVVAINAGHASNFPGASGHGMKEEDLTLKIAQYCKAELETYANVTVLMVRPGPNAPFPVIPVPGQSPAITDIMQRLDWAKEHGTVLYLDLHLNAGSYSAVGAEVYYPNENYNAAIGQEGKEVATKIVNQLAALGLNNRGAKIRNSEDNSLYEDGSLKDYYATISGAKIRGFIGLLVEHAFLSTASDAEKLKDENFLKQLGVADAVAVAEKYGLQKRLPNGNSVEITEVEMEQNEIAGTIDVMVSGIDLNPTWVSNVKLSIWTEVNGQDDLRVVTPVYDSKTGTYNYTIDAKDHNNETGKYIVFTEVTPKNSTAVLTNSSSIVLQEVSITIHSPQVAANQLSVSSKVSVENSQSIASLTFAVWSDKNGQDDIKWYPGVKSGNDYTAQIDIQNHKTDGNYSVHIYARLTNGTQKIIGNTTFSIAAPVLQISIENSHNNGTFDITVSSDSPSGITSVRVPVWTNFGGQDDLRWYDAIKQADGTFTVTIFTANHKFEAGLYHVHAYAIAGNGISFAAAKTTTISETTTTFQASVVNQADSIFTIGAQISLPMIYENNLKNVHFAVWSIENGQDDLVWYNGVKSENVYFATVDIKNHKTTGDYLVHTYALLANGTRVFIGDTSFSVSAPTVSVSVENIDSSRGSFDVVATVSSASGVSSVLMPVWTASNGQDDLRWYTAQKQTDGTYKITVQAANHKYEGGTYIVHTYATAGNGIQAVAGNSANMSLQTTVSPTLSNQSDTIFMASIPNVPMPYAGQTKAVYFATWSIENGQDDIVWYNGTKSGESYSAQINIRNHKTAGNYVIHMYALLANGMRVFIGETSFSIAPPTVSVSVGEVDTSRGSFDVIATVSSVSGVSSVLMPVWTESGGQDDLRWYTAEKQTDGTYKITVQAANHKYESGTYIVHTYATAGNGVQAATGNSANMSFQTTVSPTLSNQSDTIFMASIPNVPMPYAGQTKAVYFATWSIENGQDDIVWYNGTKSGEGYSAQINIRNHKTAGNYVIHMYALLANGMRVFIGETSFSVAPPSLSVSVGDFDVEKGTFDVVATVNSTSGVASVSIPVWTVSGGQDDITWYEAQRQANGTYKTTININNHKYESGSYIIHAYATTGNGIRLSAGSEKSISFSSPSATVSLTDKKSDQSIFTVKAQMLLPAVYENNLKNVFFAVWSIENGQDDLIWYTGSLQGSGNYFADIFIANHASRGTYAVHTYIEMQNGMKFALSSDSFSATPAIAVGNTAFSPSSKTFSIIVQPFGVELKEVLIPVWTKTNGQDDLWWYGAQRQADGKYVVTVNISNHNYEFGQYEVHVYVQQLSGASSTFIAQSVPVQFLQGNSNQVNFINSVAGPAMNAAGQQNLYPSVMIAQACLETGYGTSALSKPPIYNLFGIKGSYNGQYTEIQTSEYINNTWITVTASFKKYPSYQESFYDNADKLRNGITSDRFFYSGTWRERTTSYRDATAWLTGRYATDPNYANKLNAIIEMYNLTMFD